MAAEYANGDGNVKKKRVALAATRDLFGDTEFESAEMCLDYMTQNHGFFVPRPRRLTDLEALLTTAGKIIGERFQCVWCWKNHRSLKAVQAHMRDMGHCKLQMEEGPHWAWEDSTDEAPSPFEQYFDFEKDLSKDLEAKFDDESAFDEMMIIEARGRREITAVNESLELVRSDGTVIGHRGNAMAYRQKHAQIGRETQSEQQIIAQINNPQRKFKLMEMAKLKEKQAFEDSGANQQSVGDKGRDAQDMNAQTRKHKVSFQNWSNLQKSRQLAYN